MKNNDWLAIDVLEDYLEGKLDAKTMHQIEKISLDDIFISEALAGLSQAPKRSQNLSLLQKQLQQRVAQKPVLQKKWQITSQRLSIASAAAVLCIAVSVLFWMKQAKRAELLAKLPKKVEVTLAPRVSAQAPTAAALALAPLAGWSSYKTYLQTNNSLTKRGLIGKAVTLSFQADAKGNPIHIKVQKPLGAAYNKEAIRLLKEGPKWDNFGHATHKGLLKVDF